MRKFALPTAAILLLVSLTPEVQAARKPLELRWSELANMVVGHKVAVTLTDDLIVGGEVASVRDESIVLDVTAPTKGFPQGNGVVPRATIKLISLETMKGSVGRAVGTTLGVLMGMPLGALAADKVGGTGPRLTAFFLVAGATSTTGYYLGRELDRRITQIKIIP